MHERPWRLVTVTVFGALLVVQGFFSFIILPEPYPTIRMPGFGLAATTDGTLPVVIAHAEAIDENGSVQAISPTSLMNQFRFSTARPSYDYLFGTTSNPALITPEVKEWLRNRIEVVSGGTRAVEVRMCWQKTDVSVFDASLVRQEPCVWRAIKLD